MSITEGQFIISTIMIWGWWLGEDFWGTPVVVPPSISSFFFTYAPSFLSSFFMGLELIYSDLVCFVAGGVFTITTPLEIMSRVVKHEKKLVFIYLFIFSFFFFHFFFFFFFFLLLFLFSFLTSPPFFSPLFLIPSLPSLIIFSSRHLFPLPSSEPLISFLFILVLFCGRGIPPKHQIMSG